MIVGLVYVEQSDDVGVVTEGLKEDNFSEGPLRIGLVAECIKDFLDGDLNEVEKCRSESPHGLAAGGGGGLEQIHYLPPARTFCCGLSTRCHRLRGPTFFQRDSVWPR